MASLLDRIYDNHRQFLIKKQADEMHELVEDKSFSDTEKANFCKRHSLTNQDLEDLLHDDLDAFVDRHSGAKDFPWIEARLRNFLKADALLDEYRNRGWTIFVDVFHTADDDRVIRTQVRDTNNKEIQELTQDFYSTVRAESWLAWKLQSEHPLSCTISDDLRDQYPVSEAEHFSAVNKHNANELANHYLHELDDLYCDIRIRQEGQNFVYTTSVSHDPQSTSFFYDHKNDIQKYIKDFPSYYSAIVWLALTIEKDFPINKTVAEKLKEEFPIWNPDELPTYITDDVTRHLLSENLLDKSKITDPLVKKYIQDVVKFKPE